MKIRRWARTLRERRRCSECSNTPVIPWYRPIKRYRRFDEATRHFWTRWQVITWLTRCSFDFKFKFMRRRIHYLEHVLGYHEAPK